MPDSLSHRPAWSTGRRRSLRGGIAASFVVAGLVTLLLAADSFPGDNNAALLRVGFSARLFADVNENDAKASVKAWAQVLFKERNIPIDPDVKVLKSIEEISRALQGKTVDAMALATDEYWALGRDLLGNELVVNTYGGIPAEEYLLLVHRDGGIERIEDLQGRSLNFFQNVRMSLALPWLDTVLDKGGFGPAAGFFGSVKQANKLSGVILPVFFRQSNACIVTRRGFQTMSELNPQLGRQLKVLVSSPALVPGGFCFRRDYNSPFKDSVLAEFGKVHTTPAGQQTLTIFQADRLEVHPISILDRSLEVLALHGRLSTATNGAGSVDAGLAPGKDKTGAQ